jgi:hypothetical protein
LTIGLKPHHIKAPRLFDMRNFIIRNIKIGASFSTESPNRRRSPRVVCTSASGRYALYRAALDSTAAGNVVFRSRP